MAKFVDINSLTEKVNPDGNEQIQVSNTQKFVWKNVLMNSGEFIGAILSYATQYAMGDTTNRKTIMSMLGQLFYNTGSRADSFFRFVCGSVTIPGGTPKQEYFGIVFYDAYYTRTYAVFFGFENNSVPITFFQRQGNYVTDSPIDDNFVTNIINGTAWTKLGTLDFITPLKPLAAEKVNVAAPTLYDETTASTWQPDAANNLQELLNGLLYRTGLRSTSDGLNVGFRVVCAAGKIAIIANDSSSDYSVFLFSGGSTIHTYLIDQQYVMEWVGGYSSDQDIINSIENDGNETGMLDMAGISNFATKAYVKPNDAVLTMFPSGYRTVIPGENLTTNLTSGTLKIKVPDLLTAQVKNGPFRDAVIDVPYGVTVQFADQVGIVYKADGVDGFTATSGRKVYTIHFVPTTSSTTNITFRAFVNVTNYK